jgi:CRISPR-associated protein Cas1
VQISVLNWDGKLLTTMLLHESTNEKQSFSISCFRRPGERGKDSKKVFEAKFNKYQRMS